MENKIQSFEDLHIWQESIQLCYDIYDAIALSKDFGLKDQIQRSSVSVPSNIAEGFERETEKEFIRFLYIAKGSTGELRTQLYIARHRKMIDHDQCSVFIDKTKRNASMIHNLIRVKKGRIKKQAHRGTE